MAGSEPGTTERLHATCIAIDGKAALLLGPSGSGKSDLGLRLIHSRLLVAGRPVTAHLVADDQVVLEAQPGRLIARPPASLAGLCEVRGLGILRLPHRAEADVTLAIKLTSPQDIERLPDRKQHFQVLQHRLPLVHLAPFEASAPLKVALALLLGPESWNP